MVGGAADHHPVEAAGEEGLGRVEAVDAAVDGDREVAGSAPSSASDEAVVERRDLAVLLRAQALRARPCGRGWRRGATPGRGDQCRGRPAAPPRGPARRRRSGTSPSPAPARRRRSSRATQSATSSGVRISAAPKQPDCTRSDGQPTLRLISSNPSSRPIARRRRERRGLRAAELQRQRDAPPDRKPSSRSRSPCSTAAAVTISV